MLAETADTLVSLQKLDDAGFLHGPGTEHLITGAQDWTPVPESLGRHLDAKRTTGGDPTFVYGWPVLVARNQKNHPVIAPLFQVSVRAEQRDGRWIGEAETEPEFNPTIVAGELFDMSAKEETDAIVGDGVPFGDSEALVRMARSITEVLGVDIVSDLDPRSLRPHRGAVPGVHNAAIWVPADDSGGASRFLLAELEALACRKDWAETAAACLVERLNPANPAPPRRTRSPRRSPATTPRRRPSTGFVASR